MSKPKLALIPSGYKSGKVYSILPNDATGDFDFTRQSIGTRVRKDGLIEEAKTVGSITNELLYSEDYSQSQWSKIRSTISTDQTLAPDGTNTADKIIPTVDNNTHRCDQVITLTDSAVYTLSFYAKEGGYNCIRASIGQTGLTFGSLASFNLNTETVSITGTVRDAQIQSIANDWYRCSITMDAGTSDRIVIGIGNNNSYSFAGDTTNGVFMWGAMVSEGALSDYIKTEGSQVTKTVETFTDVPRLDWLNSNCPSLLLEPQRSNLFAYSEDTSQWASIRGTTTSNNIIAPNGELVGSLYEKTEDANEGYVYRNLTVSSVGTYSVSVFFKYNNSQYAHFLLFDGSSNGARAWFDIQNGVVGTSTTFGSTFTVSDLSIENYGNGWYKCSAKYVVTGTDTTWQFRVSPSGGNGVTNTNSGAKIYFFGAQIEQGNYPTSYIKTEASAVTRLKDECFGSGTADLFDTEVGVIYLELKKNGLESSFSGLSLSDGTTSNRIEIRYVADSNTIQVVVRVGGSAVVVIGHTITDVTERHKIAFKFEADNYAFWVNGAEVGTDTSGALPPNLSEFAFDDGAGNFEFFGSVYDARVYTNDLTDTELTELTTL